MGCIAEQFFAQQNYTNCITLHRKQGPARFTSLAILQRKLLLGQLLTFAKPQAAVFSRNEAIKNMDKNKQESNVYPIYWDVKLRCVVFF